MRAISLKVGTRVSHPWGVTILRRVCRVRTSGNVGLDKEDALFGVQARGQPVEEHLLDVVLELVGVFQSGQGVNVDGAVYAVVVVLKGDVVLDCAEVVAEVLPTRGPCPGEHPAFFAAGHAFRGWGRGVGSGCSLAYLW